MYPCSWYIDPRICINFHQQNAKENNETMTSNSILFINSLNYSGIDKPEVSSCGTYLAYVFHNTTTTDDKLIIRQLSDDYYNTVLDVNLSSLDRSLEILEQLNKLGDFLDVHNIRSTYKTAVDYQHHQVEVEKQESRVLNHWQIKIVWEPCLFRASCYRVAVLYHNSVYVLDIVDGSYYIRLSSNADNLFSLGGVSWLGDSYTEESSINNYLAVFYESDLGYKIYQLDTQELVFESHKCKFSRYFRRSELLNSFDYSESSENSNFYSFIDHSKHISNFKVHKPLESEKQLVRVNRFKLPDITEQLCWSPTGKWLCVLENQCHLSFYNILGLGSKPVLNEGTPVISYNLDSYQLLGGYTFYWAMFALKHLNEVSFDNNYNILNSTAEVVLVTDYSETIQIISTFLGTKLIVKLSHDSVLDTGDYIPQVWRLEPNNYIRQVTPTDKYIYLHDDFENASQLKGVAAVKSESIASLEALSQFDDKQFTSSYYLFLVESSNFIATKCESKANLLYIWELNSCLTSQAPWAVFVTLSAIKSFDWHSRISNLLLIVSETEVLIWHSKWLEPLLVLPVFKSKPQKGGLEDFETNKAFKLCGASWIPTTRAPFIKIVCWNTKREFTIIKLRLTTDQLQAIRLISQEYVDSLEEPVSSKISELFFFESASENADSDESIQLLIDDDTKAVEIIDNIKQTDWAEDDKNRKVKQEDDTFGYRDEKKPKIYMT